MIILLLLLAGSICQAHTPVIDMINENNMPELKNLIEKGFDVNERDEQKNTPLHHATMKRNVPSAQAIINAGADVNAVNKEGQTALHLAKDDQEFIMMLLGKGANAYIRDNKGNLPFESIKPQLKIPEKTVWDSIRLWVGDHKRVTIGIVSAHVAIFIIWLASRRQVARVNGVDGQGAATMPLLSSELLTKTTL